MDSDLRFGASHQQILADYPQLEPDDFLAVYESLSPRLVLLLRDPFPDSESALRNGLARA